MICIQTVALYAFINLLPPEIVEIDDTVVTVVAEQHTVTYTFQGEDLWCFDKEELDRQLFDR